MSLALTIANRYARAGFKIALEHNLIDQFLSDLQSFCDNVPASFLHELANPTIARQNLVLIIEEMAQKINLNIKVTQFLMTIANAHRIKFLYQIHDSFIKYAKESKKILNIELLTATPLNNDQLNQIESSLRKKYPHNIFEIKQIINKDILGGLMVKIGSFVIDASLKNQLSKIAINLRSAII